MNEHQRIVKVLFSVSFRPQQGLLIMNASCCANPGEAYTQFPSPTGVSHYELF